MPFAVSHHRHLLPLYPWATESLDLRGYDLVLSSDSGPIKGVRVDSGATHICYCHSPMRYLWDGYEAYRGQMGSVTRAIFTATAGRVRAWDRRAADRVTYFLANSQYVADRIRRAYGRESTVIHPPIDLHRGNIDPAPGAHYLCAGRLGGYKRPGVASTSPSRPRMPPGKRSCASRQPIVRAASIRPRRIAGRSSSRRRCFSGACGRLWCRCFRPRPK